MKSSIVESQQSWFMRNRMTALTVVIVAAYALFVQWFWGWPVIISQWADVGAGPVIGALVALTSTYFLRTWRIYDYFPTETAGRFATLFRVTQIHNLLNIMLPFRTGETSFPLLMRTEFGIPLTRGTSALLVMRLLDLHALLAAAGIGFALAAPDALVAWSLWAAFLLLPVAAFAARKPLLRVAARLLPAKVQRLVVEIENGLPLDAAAFARAWEAGHAMTEADLLDEAIAMRAALPAKPESAAATGLSARELDILQRVAAGLSNQQIADQLFVSVRTVTSHITSIHTKLGVESRTAAVAYAIRSGLA